LEAKLEIPQTLLEKYQIDENLLERTIEIGLKQLRIEEALALYSKGLISLWKAAEMAGLTLQEMVRHANLHGCKPRFDFRMIQEELS